MNDQYAQAYGEEYWFFQEPGSGVAWDEEVYAPGTYESFIWDLQQVWLRRIADSVRAAAASPAHLDFACGTGRVLAALAPTSGTSTGVDMSADMVSVARAKLPTADFRIGDILTTEGLLDHEFDLITAFRIVLGTEPGIRAPILTALAARLRGPQSRLVFNVHGNDWSVLGLKRRLGGSRWLADGGVTMSPPEVRRLIAATGLRLVGWKGYGVCPKLLHDTWAGRICRWIDAVCARLPLLGWISRDIVLVCSRA